MKDPIFKTHPKLKEYFKTSDGNAFFTEHDAKTHATSLKNKKVEKVERAKAKAKAPADENENSKTATKKGDKKDAPVKDDTNVDNASYAELMLFVKDNEIELSSKKAEDVRTAIKAYLANPNKKIVPFKGNLIES